MKHYTVNLGDPKKGTPYFSNATEATIGLVPNPKWWIRWPTLPLKNTKLTFPDNLGYMIVRTYNDTWEGPYPVREGNVLAPSVADRVIAIYDTVEELLNAGWIID